MNFPSSDLAKIDKKFLWHPYTKYSSMEQGPLPIIERGDGFFLIDNQGNRYLDAISSWWSCNLGHCHPQIVQTIKDQAECLEHCIIGNLSHPTIIKLAGSLANLFADRARHIFFASDGSCAVEAALKIAIQYWFNRGEPKKNRFVSLTGDYHGDTLGSVSVGFVETFHHPFAQSIIPAYQAEAPFCRHCKYGKNPDNCSLECFAPMEEIISKNASQIAAVIVEPLCQGAAGMRIYAAKYLKRLSDVCQQYDALLIIDEIAMGFGRTGKMFAFQHADIDPDLVCLGKGLSNGTLPISATVVKNHIYNTFTDKPRDNTFYHGHTFTGNPLAAAVALKVLEIYEQEAVVEQAHKKGELLQEEMRKFEEMPTVVNTRCLGMIGAVEIKEGTVSNQSGEMGRMEAIRQYLMSQDLLFRPLGNVLYLMPPLVIPDSLLRETIDSFYEAIKRVG